MTEQLTPEACREYLRAVIDPEIFQNIVDLGLVYGIEVGEGNQVVVNMTLTTPHCPLGPQIIADVEGTLLGMGASTAAVNIVWEPMWTPDAMTEELQRELGILPNEEEEPEPELYIPPPASVKKKSLFGRIFGS